MRISLLTGGGFKSYSLCLLQGLVAHGIEVDFVGNDEMSTAAIVAHHKVNFLNLRGDQSPKAPLRQKLWRVPRYYLRLFRYVSTTDSRLFHIQALNKFVLFDRTLLSLYYKLIGKKLVLTAHNIDAAQRDGGDSWANRTTLKIFYGLMDHIFVHTEKMKSQLSQEFGIDQGRITVIPHGILETIPRTGLSRAEARRRLQLEERHKVLLFFGNIAPYKGLEFLLQALGRLTGQDDSYRLVIAGQVKGCQPYWQELEAMIAQLGIDGHVIREARFIPDSEVETFFTAADALVLPYRFIFQSGVPFLSFNFGLPVIATDVGSLSEHVIEGETGSICLPQDPDDLSRKIAGYFAGPLYQNLDANRGRIIARARENYSWESICMTILEVYRRLLPGSG